MLPKYKRILLKLSGESLMGDKSFGMDPNMIEQYAKDIKGITELGVQVAVVIGGGNIYRGMNEKRHRYRKGSWRLHGYARHSYQRHGHAGNAGESGRLHPLAERHQNGTDSRTLYQAPRHQAPRKGQGSDLRRRYRQPLFHHRHRRFITGNRDPGRRNS